MYPLRNRNGRAPRPFITAAACLALLLLVSLVASAQTTVTAKPDRITDATKAQSVVLSITNTADGSANATVSGQVAKVTVAGQDAQFQKDVPAAGSVTVTAPAGLNGPQPVQLLDSAGKPLDDGTGKPLGLTLTYPNLTTTPTPTPTPTPDPAILEKISVVNRQNELSKQEWYQFFVLISFIGVLTAFIGTIVRGILRSRSTFRNPLGLPVGSLRAILAYTLVAFLGFYVLTSLLTITVFAPPDFLLGIVATVVGFYFGSRSDEEGAQDERVGIVRGIVRKDKPGSGAPVSGALVKFKRDDGTEPYSRLTDVDGRFVLQGAKPGKYKVIAKLSDASLSPEQDLSITEGSDQEIELVIKSGGGGGGGDAATPKTGSVEGEVTNADGSAADGASVVLSQGGAEKGKATADADGSYKIDNVAVGEYDAVATLGAASSAPVKVTVAAGAAQTLDLNLP